jgi:hypothetical protein
MAHPWVVDGGDGFQMWRVAADVLNRQLWPADKGYSSSLGVGRGAINFSTIKSHLITKCYTGLQIWADCLE